MSVSSRLMPLLALAMTMMVGCSVTPNEQPAALANADVENPDQVTCKTVVKTGTRQWANRIPTPAAKRDTGL